MLNSQLLSIAAYGPKMRCDWTKKHGIRTDEALIAIQDRIKNAISKSIQKLSGKQMIVSSEHCSLRLDTPDRVARLKKVMDDLGFGKVTILVYLRPQAEFAYSIYAESIKNGQAWDVSYPPLLKKSKKYINRFNYEYLLTMWQDAFGEDAVKPRFFQQDEFHGGSIETDFIRAIGAEWDQRFRLPEQKNIKMSKMGLEIMRRINHILPCFIDDAPNPLRRGQRLEQLIQIAFGQDAHRCPAAMVAEYERYYDISNRAVCEKWFPERTALFEPKPISNEPLSTPDPSEYDQLADILARGWLHRHDDVSVGSPEHIPT